MTRISIVTSGVGAVFWMLVAQPPQSRGAQHEECFLRSSPLPMRTTEKISIFPTGDTLVVRLKSNPSTGYTWAIKGDPSPLRLVKSSAKKNNQTGHAAGAPVTQEFRLSATSAGMASLTLEYRRPWEYTAGPAKTFDVQVNAR